MIDDGLALVIFKSASRDPKSAIALTAAAAAP
jgi:hypothetical protein